MTRTWMFRLLRGALAAFLIGAVLGGFEASAALRTSVTELVNALQRLQLWLGNALAAGLVAAIFGTMISGAVGSVAGFGGDDQSLAVQTGRDPLSPWLPWVSGGSTLGTLALLTLPGLLRASVAPRGGARVAVVLVLVLVVSLVVAIGSRMLLRRFDVTGRGAGLVYLGLPTLLLLSMSLSVSAGMRGGRGTQVKGREGVPNVLLVTIDGLRSDHVGAGARVRTPTLQWMAREGVSFVGATTPSTSETPPLGAILTGRHPLATGMLADGQRLPLRMPGTGAELQTLAEKLRGEGYSTGAFVSSAALEGSSTGLSRGFTVYDDGIGTRLRGGSRLALPTLRRWVAAAGHGPPPGRVLRSAKATIDRLGEWMSWHYGENQFAWLHLTEPRNSTLGFEPRESQFIDPIPGDAGRQYGARVVGMDEVIGDLIQGLEADGLLDDWLIVIVGTRGRVPGGANPNVGDAWTQVPFILFGGGVPSGRRLTQQVRLEDVAATTLTAAGFVKRRYGDGYSLMGLVNDVDLGQLQAISVSPPRADGTCGIALREGRWKFTRDQKGNASLYDLEDDPLEVTDVQEEHPERTAAAAKAITSLLGKPQPTAIVPALDPGRGGVLRTLQGL